jgi:hypothetical protein
MVDAEFGCRLLPRSGHVDFLFCRARSFFYPSNCVSQHLTSMSSPVFPESRNTYNKISHLHKA